jgi:D-alanyl-D-alanine carboxypeptidase
MIVYWHALLGGRLLQPAEQSRLLEHLYPMFDKGTYYGRGVMLYEVPGASGPARIWLGHSGGTPGAKALVAWSASDSACVAVALTGDGSAEATAALLLRQLAAPAGSAPPATKP